MKLSVVPLLACPASGVRGPCDGSLSVGAAHGLEARTDEAVGDLLEGGLRCGRCGEEYPVLSGVALLVPKPDDYLRRYHRSITRDMDRHGEASPAARTWLARRYGRRLGKGDYGADFRFSQQFETPWSTAQALTDDPAALYGSFAEWLRVTDGQGPYDVLACWSRELANPRGLLLDAGSGGGGLLARAAPAFQAAFGVDYSFLAVLLARRAVLHRPEAERSYFLPVRCGQEVERPLHISEVASAECVVGDCAAPPFPGGLFDAVLSCNVIDIVGMKGPLDAAARMLRPGGVLALSDPFYFKEGEAPPGDPRQVVREGLAARGLRLEREQDGVPWTWATYDRHWRLYFNYCVAARKP